MAAIVEMFGVPPNLVHFSKVLQSNFEIKFTVDDVTQTMMNFTTGVKQGDILGPNLCTFFTAVVMITWRLTTNLPMCVSKQRKTQKQPVEPREPTVKNSVSMIQNTPTALLSYYLTHGSLFTFRNGISLRSNTPDHRKSVVLFFASVHV